MSSTADAYPVRTSRPQRVLPGQLVFTDRVSLEHRFLLRPDRVMREIFFALLAHYAKRHGIRVHAVVLMSTHYHLLFTDVGGCRGDFFRDFHSMLTKAVQVYRGAKSYVFDKEPTSQVVCVTEKGGVEAMAYLLGNPTAAGICVDPTTWPGLVSRVEDAGRRRTERFALPKKIRREDGTLVRFLDDVSWPDTVELVLEPLADAVGMDASACVEEIRDRLDALVANKVAEQKQRGGRFVGVWKAMRQSVFKRAASWLLPAPFRDKIRPRVKAGAGEGKARAAALVENEAFYEKHAECVARVRRGDKDVVFPAGTFRWCRVFGFPCETAAAGFHEMRSAFG